MRHRLPSVLLLMCQACTAGPTTTPPPSVALVQARDALAQALTSRDPASVSTTARAASAFEGQDPALDRLLGDALGNVLMRPADGIALLRAHPAPEDPAWVRALESAALRVGEATALEATLRETGSPSIAAPEALVAWMGARALRDPAISIEDHRAASRACALYDGQPSRGRRTVDQPAPADFFETLPKLGATLVVVGRAAVPPDPAADTGRGLQPCRRGRIWPEPAWPKPLPRHLTVGIETPTTSLYLSVRPEGGTPWVFGSTRNDVAGELVDQARMVSNGERADPAWLPTRLSRARPVVAPPLAD